MSFFDSLRDGFERVKGAMEKESRSQRLEGTREPKTNKPVNRNNTPPGSWGAGQEGLEPWDRTPFGQAGSYFGGIMDNERSDQRYEASYGKAAMDAIRAKRQAAVDAGYSGLAEMNYYESMNKTPAYMRPQQPQTQQPQYPGYPGGQFPYPYPYPYPPSPYPPTNGGINPGGMYGGGQQTQPPRGGYDGGGINPGGKYGGGGDMWAGGNPYFNEQTGQYQQQYQQYQQQQQYNQLQQQLQMLQQQIQMPQQPSMNWDSVFSALLPMFMGGGGMGGFGGYSPYSGMGGGYNNFNPYGGW